MRPGLEEYVIYISKVLEYVKGNEEVTGEREKGGGKGCKEVSCRYRKKIVNCI